MRVLWREEEPTYTGKFVRFERARCHPKPLQPGGVPIVVGGHSPAAARRAGRLGDGFFAMTDGPASLEALGVEMRRAALAAGRDPDEVEITAGWMADTRATPTAALRDTIRAYEAAGADRLVVARLFDFEIEELRRSVEDFAERILDRNP